MTTTTLTTTTIDATSRRDPTQAVTLRRVVVSEWIKLTSVRSTVIGMAAAAVAAIALGAVFAGSGTGPAAPGSGAGSTDAVTLSLAGFNLSMLIIGVLGVLTATSEYATGQIRTTFGAVARRLPVLGAKVAVYGTVVLVSMTVASLASYFVGHVMYGGDGVAAWITDPGVLRAVLGTALYMAGVGLLGIALGFLLRSAAAAIGVLLAWLLVVPNLLNLLPGSITDGLAQLLPTRAAEAFTTVSAGADLLSPGAGLVVFGLWVVGLVVAAGVAIRRRDA